MPNDPLNALDHLREHENHEKTHAMEHTHEYEATRQEERRLAELMVAHDRVHKSADDAVALALLNVEKLAAIHVEFHAREHANHEIRHEDAQQAIAKSEAAIDRRLAQMNEVRGQLDKQALTFASAERVDGMQEAMDRRFAETSKQVDGRYEENRRRIETLEKGDVKQEGRGIGQAGVVAIIVSSIGVAGTVLSIVIVLANLATGK